MQRRFETPLFAGALLSLSGSAQTQQNLALLAQERRKAAATQAQADNPTASVDTAEAASHGARLVAVAPQVYELQTATLRQELQQAKAVQAVPVAQQQSAGEKPAAKGEGLVNVAHPPPVVTCAKRRQWPGLGARHCVACGSRWPTA